MVRKLLFATILGTVLSAGAVTLKQLSTTSKAIGFCASATCTDANPGACGRCFCNEPFAPGQPRFCTKDPIGVKK